MSHPHAANKNSSKKLNSFLNTQTNTSKYSIKNSLEIAEKLKTYGIPEYAKLVSFHVTSMFSKIPTKECFTT